MSYGLSSFIKNLLPRRLFYRALLIVAVPIIVLQLVITIVFFDSLWIKTNKGMTRALVNEISTFLKVYESQNIDKKELTNLFSLFLDLNIEFTENNDFDFIIDSRSRPIVFKQFLINEYQRAMRYDGILPSGLLLLPNFFFF